MEKAPHNDPGEEDLWFLPADEPFSLSDIPLPRAGAGTLFATADWRAAEGAVATELATLTFDFGRLEERLRSLGPGARQRLALQEVAGLGWWTGDRISVDRLVLWLSQQIGATGSDAEALPRAGWAVRRLTSGPAPTSPAAIASLLGLPETGTAPDRIAETCECLDQLAGLHPVTRAAALFQLWRLGDGGDAQDAEALVLATRLAGSIAGAQSFLPQALAGPAGLAARGDPGRRLAGWLAGAHQSVLAALLHLDRLTRWQARAATATADLSGRTPPQLLQLLANSPAISAALAESTTGASRAAVQRNLDLLAARGLTRELTGQGRYRLWAAAL